MARTPLAYTFSNLVPGHYRISATYRNDSNRVIAAPYTITDGTNVLATATVNQQIQPSSLIDQGFSWTDLASIDVNSTTCVVMIKDTADQFLYVDADAIRLERTGELGAAPPPPPAPAQVYYVDDRGQGWSCVGNWGFTSESIYFNGGHSFAINGGGADVCTWTFSGLAPGKYRVSATWRGDYNRATNSPFTIFDGANSLGLVIVNQQLGAQQPVGQRPLLGRSGHVYDHRNHPLGDLKRQCQSICGCRWHAALKR